MNLTPAGDGDAGPTRDGRQLPGQKGVVLCESDCNESSWILVGTTDGVSERIGMRSGDEEEEKRQENEVCE